MSRESYAPQTYMYINIVIKLDHEYVLFSESSVSQNFIANISKNRNSNCLCFTAVIFRIYTVQHNIV